jgi:hypothetical protein
VWKSDGYFRHLTALDLGEGEEETDVRERTIALRYVLPPVKVYYGPRLHEKDLESLGFFFFIKAYVS